MLVLSSVDIYLFSPSEHFQIDRDPSILDKIPNSHGGLLQQCPRWSHSEDFKNGIRRRSRRDGVAQLPVEKEYIVGALNGHDSLFSLLFEVRVSRPMFDSANSGHCVCRSSRLEQMGQQSERGAYSWATACKQVSRATVKRQRVRKLSRDPG